MVNQRRAGALLSYISLTVNAVISFIYVPILLGALTKSEYGIYELIGSIIAYLSVMDLGLSTTLNRYYVKTKITNTKEDLENLLATSGIMYIIIGAIAVVVGIIILNFFDVIFSRSFTPYELNLAKQMMVLVIINAAIVLPGNWFLAIINANERFVFLKSFTLLKHIVQVIVIIIVLNHYPSALIVLFIQVIFNALLIGGIAFYCKTKLNVKAKLHSWNFGLVKELLTYSFFILLIMIFDQVFWKTGQVIVGAIIGAVAIGIYGIAMRVLIAYEQISVGVAGVFLPKITSLSAKSDDMSEINKIFNKVGHIQAILVGGIIAAFLVLGKQFITLWAGDAFIEAYYIISILMIARSIELVQNIGQVILKAKNKMVFKSLLNIAVAIIAVLVAIPATYMYGVLGTAISMAILFFIATGPVMSVYYQKIIGVDILDFFKQILPLLLPITLAACVTWFVSTSVFTQLSWTHFIYNCLCFLIFYFIFLALFGFNAYERELLLSFVRKRH